MNLYDALIKYKEGNADEWDVRRACDDGVVQIQTLSKKNIGKSLVSLKFNRDEYIELFSDADKEDSNNTYLMRVAIGGGHYGDVFIDSGYFSDEEWNEGYIFQHFSKENEEQFLSLVRQINPSLLDSKDQWGRYEQELFSTMNEAYNNEISQISYEYAGLYDECLVEGLREYVQGKTCDKFSLYGIYEKTCAHQYYTTIDILLSMWKRTETPQDEGILKVLKNLADQSNLLIDEDLYEDYYNYYDSKNFDQESFDRVVKSNLDKIQEKVDEQNEEGDLVKNREIYEKISKLGYKFGVWYDLPTQKNYGEKTNQVFKLERVEKGKIELMRKDKGNYYNVKQSKMSFEDFLNYLYHPELFN
jgi:hypothetical protein